MAKPQQKKVVVHSRIKAPWRLGSYWFTYGPNPFTRQQYQEFEVHPLFLRQLAAGKFKVVDPEYPAPPSDPVPAEAKEETVPATQATEGGEVDAEQEEAPAKVRGRKKSSEVSPS